MDAVLIERIEANVERLASALFGVAVGYAVYSLLDAGFSRFQLGSVAASATMLAYLLCGRALRQVSKTGPQFGIHIFDLRKVETFEDELLLTDTHRLAMGELLLTDADRLKDELVLTDADRLEPDSTKSEPLVLDDILAELGPDSRVVRLFDPRTMPTPGQLKSRIDDHLEQEAPQPGASDASQALSAALAQLRRSLR
jgi:hypothetical protein